MMFERMRSEARVNSCEMWSVMKSFLESQIDV